MTLMRRSTLLAAAAALLAACVAPAAGAPAKSGAPAPAAVGTPTPQPSCLDSRVTNQVVPPTARNLAGIAPRVLVGTLASLGAGHWNTPDGRMPADPSGVAVAIYTDATFSPAASLRGAAAPTWQLRVEGGTVGCSRQEFDPPTTLSAGTRYLVWVEDAYDQPVSGNSTPWVMYAWPVGAGDRVATPKDGTLSLADISAILKAYPLGSHGQCQGGQCP